VPDIERRPARPTILAARVAVGRERWPAQSRRARAPRVCIEPDGARASTSSPGTRQSYRGTLIPPTVAHLGGGRLVRRGPRSDRAPTSRACASSPAEWTPTTRPRTSRGSWCAMTLTRSRGAQTKTATCARTSGGPSWSRSPSCSIARRPPSPIAPASSACLPARPARDPRSTRHGEGRRLARPRAYGSRERAVGA
jgi:hypothetical protein